MKKINYYIDENGINHKPIFCAIVPNNFCNYFISHPEWYFSDETEDIHGPFSTFNECKENLERYMNFISSDNQERVVRCNYENSCRVSGMQKDPREFCLRCSRYISHESHLKEYQKYPTFMIDFTNSDKIIKIKTIENHNLRKL